MRTCPCMLHLTYTPPANPLIVRLSSSALLTASWTSTRSTRPALSQSTRYIDTMCWNPSATFTSIETVPLEDHAAAIRSSSDDFHNPRTSVVEAAHVIVDAAVVTVTCGGRN